MNKIKEYNTRPRMRNVSAERIGYPTQKNQKAYFI